MRAAWFGTLAIAIFATSAVAGPMPDNALDGDDAAWFYNKVGATPADVASDMRSCGEFVDELTKYTGGNSFGLVGAIMADALSAGPKVGMFDDCMIARGYRRFDTADANMRTFQARFDAMGEAAQAALVSSATPPEGRLSRVRTNNYWMSQDGDPPSRSEQLSSVSTVIYRPARREIRSTPSDEPISPASNEAVLVLRVRTILTGRMNSAYPPRILFTLDDPQTGAPQLIAIGPNNRRLWPVLSARPERMRPSSDHETSFVFVAPAGHYALSQAEIGIDIQFCFGTIGFDVAPGAVVDLGQIVLHQDARGATETAPPARFGLRVNPPDIERARAALARAPELAARLETVTYRNGDRHACEAMISYQTTSLLPDGFEIPWASWRPEDGIDPQASVR